MIGLKTFAEFTEPERPKRPMLYTLVWCSQGSCTVYVDDKALVIRADDILTITSGQVFYFINIDEAVGLILQFSFDFFCKDEQAIELVFHNGLFCHFDLNEIIPINNSVDTAARLNVIKKELADRHYQYPVVIRSQIELLLVDINRAKILRGDEIWKPNALYLKFLDAVRTNFQSNYSVKEFAQILQTTEIKLNDYSKQFTGKTAQMVIYGLIISEAKRLLRYEDLSIKEIAHKLGFSDPFYFSNFFKKHTQQSPKTYKEEYLYKGSTPPAK